MQAVIKGSPVVVGRPVQGYEVPADSKGSATGKATAVEPDVEDQRNSWNVADVDSYGGGLTGEHRANFIRKVYGILTAQMAITVSICALAMLIPQLRAMFVGFMMLPYAQLIIFVPAIATLCALQAKKAEHPTNYYLLWTFTVLMSISIAGICAVYQTMGAGTLILQAFAITMVAFGSLTLYAMKSGKDFTWMGGMLYMGLMGMIMFSFMGFLFGFHGGAVFSLFGVVLFCGYILYDTSRVMKIYGPDDAIVAAVELYLDILNLFLYILELLSQCQGGSD